MKRLAVYLLLALVSIAASAQSTTVSATITDGDGNAWVNGTWKANLVLTPQIPGLSNYTWTGGTITQQFSGSLDSTGAFSQALPDNTTISPGGTKWLFTVCSKTSNGFCSTLTTAVSGGSQSLTAALSAVAGQPRFECKISCYGYSTAEVLGTPAPGTAFTIIGANTNSTQFYNNGWSNTANTSPSFISTQVRTTGNGPVVNQLRLWDFVLPYPVSATKIALFMGAADNSANLYNVGIFSYAGAASALACQTGPFAGSTLGASGNVSVNLNFTAVGGGACVLNADRYIFAFTGQASTLNFNGGSTMHALDNVQPSVGNATSGAVFVTPITPPAESWSSTGTGIPQFTLHN